ncbi:class I SAM-dependent methyltransferase [Desulfatibacillum aliphaticivorans]|uniref:class I SAM-dependent methyltransferase n=1 Tax=Desulfatibacillum aliphaticivorans TaxID=218208 RepID=UPI0003FB3C3D|nr:methyltransferase domain-containing protein [Desulfatibacillum aliphaticivorans]
MTRLTLEELHQSPIVANCCMNRERQAIGDNSYQKELPLNPDQFLREGIESQETGRWLDLCCGQGLAMLQLMAKYKKARIDGRFQFMGVDLTGAFAPIPEAFDNLRFVESALEDFRTSLRFDLITCVHGMHYIGDKIGVIIKYIQCLTPDGIFACNLDTNNIFNPEGRKMGIRVNKFFRSHGLEYDARKKILLCRGPKFLQSPFVYLGADDAFGKNYTGQQVVASCYEE